MTHDPTRPRQFAFGPFRLFPAQQLLLEGESPVRLGSRARDLLIALIEQAGQVVTREALSARVWPNIVVEEGALRVHVAALRKALRDGQEGRRYIANVPGRGYSFVGKVVATDEPNPTADAAPEPVPPLSMARLFGRAEVVETLSTRLPQQRLITITGPGGIGKTSVALAVADRMHPRLPDGVCIVDFAPLADGKLVPTALASALGIGVLSENPLPSLIALLRSRDMLIVLDNCEHVIDAAALLAESIVQGGARLRVLATSREPIRVSGEMLFRLAPLAMPEISDGLTAPIAMTYSAVQLFVERAAMCLGEFSLTDTRACSRQYLSPARWDPACYRDGRRARGRVRHSRLGGRSRRPFPLGHARPTHRPAPSPDTQHHTGLELPALAGDRTPRPASARRIRRVLYDH